MSLAPSQYAAVKAFILADPVLSQAPANEDGDDFIANAMNLLASPAFVVWKTKVSQDEIMQNGFDWLRVDNLSVGKARIWEWLFDNDERSINPSKANVRAGISEAWKGTAADVAVRDAVLGHCKRNASIIEKLLANTSEGNGQAATPATMTFSGNVTRQEIGAARNS